MRRWVAGLAAVLAGATVAAGFGLRHAHEGAIPPHPSAHPAAAAPVNWTGFHGDAARTGWDARETVLTPGNVGGGRFGPLWESPALDPAIVDGRPQAPHIYATPLYVDDLRITSGRFSGGRFGAVVTATGAGWAYAIKAFDAGAPGGVAVGTILWRHFLGPPTAGPDGGVALGVLGTPVVDLATSPPRLYVASDVTDSGGRSWRVFALDAGSGEVLPGWPLVIDDGSLAPITVNGPSRFQGAAAMAQRGALNLSPDGRYLYVPFGAYGDGGTGYMVQVDARAARLVSAFAGAPSTAAVANAGMWGSGGAAVDAAGRVYETTGNSRIGSDASPGVWGNSLLVWAPGTPLRLVGTYSPWNHCQMDRYDTDLGGSSPMLVPSLGSGAARTPPLVGFGGKQGNAYIVDRDRPPGSLTQRPPCSTDASTDRSLLPPGAQPQFGRPGPLNVFGPYSDDAYNQADFSKARSTPAFFRDAGGTGHLFFSGSTKLAHGRREVMPPGLVRTDVVTAAGRSYLTRSARDSALSLLSPGSPVVTSDGASNAIVWLLDANLFRSAPLVGAGAPHPVLYAVDATSMRLLWRSAPSQLGVGGKYSHPVVAHGVVIVATDRVQAFGLS